MPWFPLDTHYLSDPKVQHAASLTPFALSAFPALLAEAKQRADGGRVEVTYRDLAHALWVSEDEAIKAVRALVECGVLELDADAPRDKCGHANVRFPAWRRWNETFRKAQSRGSVR